MKAKKACWIVFFLLILAVSIGFGSFISVFEDTKNENRMRDFYLIPEDTLDVVFVGSSSVHTNFYPTLAWKNYGFTSYCLGMDRCSYVTIESMVKEVIRTQHPKLIVVDIDEYTWPDDYMSNEHPIYFWLDAVPWNKTKLETISESIPASKKLYYYFPFIRTHSVFSDPEALKSSISMVKRYVLKKNPEVYLKGAELSNVVEKDVEYLIDYRKINEVKKIGDVAERYLDELLDFCRNCDTKIIFIDYPKGRIKDDTEYYEKVYTIPLIQKKIENAGFEVFNYNTLDNPAGITLTDFFKPESHLNINGCEKFTNYFSDYLVNNCGIKSEHSDEVKSQWDADAEVTDALLEKLGRDTGETVVNENTLNDYMQ